jgi:hypothetical protein
MSLLDGVVVSGGKVIAVCERCKKPVQLNKKMLGAYHFCVSDCEMAGKHLAVREEVRGQLWWRRTWRVCDGCGREARLS